MNIFQKFKLNILASFKLSSKSCKNTTHLDNTSTGDLWFGDVDMFGCWWNGCWYGKNPRLLWRLLFVIGDFDRSFFFKLKFSGAMSSGAESTSKSLSGELGDWLSGGDTDNGSENDLFFGLLGDSEPVSWSVSAERRARLFPTVRW